MVEEIIDGLERQFRLVRGTIARWPAHMRQLAGFVND